MKTLISAVLLSGGVGTRLGASIPKQYLMLNDKPIALHSFELLASNPLIHEVVVVCDPYYDALFQKHTISKALHFARPGAERQNSLFNGLQKIASQATHVLIHDAARPFINDDMIKRVIDSGLSEGAATLAMPVKATIKEADDQNFVIKTPDRKHLFEIQTPQVIKKELLRDGFEYADSHGLKASDDVYFAEILGHKAKLVRGCYTNIKVTTIEDLEFARFFSEKIGNSMT